MSTSTPPGLFVPDDDPYTLEYFGRAVTGGEGREKQIVDPEWNRRIADIGGRDVFGRPFFRAAWGWNELAGNGDLRYPHVPFQWLLLRRFPAAAWGTRRNWYSPRLDEGRWVPSLAETFQEEYPWAGGEEIDYAFPKGVRFFMPYIEMRLRRFVNRPKLPSREQRIRDSRRELEAQEQEAWNRDYEEFMSMSRAFYGNAFVGYGSRKSPDVIVPKLEPMTPGMNEKFEGIHANRMARWKRQGKRVVN